MIYNKEIRVLATLLTAMLAAPIITLSVSAQAIIDSGRNVLVGTDGASNAYTGDTSIKESRGLMCISKTPLLPLPANTLTPFNTITPGGAIRNSWSGGRLFVVPNISGTLLKSRAVSDQICNKYGQKIGGARMAEFHDGTPTAGNPAGWSFWADGSVADPNDLVAGKSRLWIAINDQNANPWNTTTGKALTFIAIKWG